MIYLLDTHYLLWSLFDPEKITTPIRKILEDEQYATDGLAVIVGESNHNY